MRYVHHGCPHSSLLFDTITHPLLVMLFMINTTNGNIVGLHHPSRGQLVAQDLANDPFMFLQASCENLEKWMLVLH